MKHFYLLMFTIFFYSLSCYSQSNFKPGYVVTLKGDTLNGDIDYREWSGNPDGISFKTSSGIIKKFTPVDLLSFQINNLDSYQRYSGAISHDETIANRVTGGRDTSSFTKEVFLRILTKGPVVTLYEYIDAIKPRYFYSEPTDRMPRELVYRLYYGYDNVTASQRTISENTYAQQLSAVALKNNVMDEQLQHLIERLSYDKPDLIKIAVKMNGGAATKKAASPTYDDTAEGSTEFYAGIGVNITRFTPHNGYVDAGGSPNTSTQPRVTLGFNGYANKNTRKVFFSVDFGIAQNKYSDLFSNKIAPYIGLEYKFNQLEISVTPQIIFNFYNAENFKVFAGIGYDLSHYTYSNKVYQRQDGQKFNTDQRPFDLDPWGNAISFKVGCLVKKKFQIYAGYFTTTGISYDNFLDITQSSFQAGVNYIFK